MYLGGVGGVEIKEVSKGICICLSRLTGLGGGGEGFGQVG